jgi:enhancing lycopene biosynthesis protein 2
MHANAAQIESLYGALGRHDGATMAACYGPDAKFTDPIFDLRGTEIGAMWTMLCARARDITVEWRNVEADDARGQADWDAHYTFGATGRNVHNRIHSDFTFAAGRIAVQRDSFDIGRWLRMAIGPIAFLPGAAALLHRRVRRQARGGLDDWIERHGGTLPSHG